MGAFSGCEVDAVGHEMIAATSGANSPTLAASASHRLADKQRCPISAWDSSDAMSRALSSRARVLHSQVWQLPIAPRFTAGGLFSVGGLRVVFSPVALAGVSFFVKSSE